MITLRKLASLADGTRRRKLPHLLRDIEEALVSGRSVDRVFLRGLLRLVSGDEAWPESLRQAADAAADAAAMDNSEFPRQLNSLRHGMLDALGVDWADWDRRSPMDDLSDRSGIEELSPVRVLLDGVRSPFNVGSIMRTAWAFGFERLWIRPETASPEHRRARRSAMGAAECLAWDVSPPEGPPRDVSGPLFALELGGTDIGNFPFPGEGTVVLGSEEWGVSPSLMRRARADGGVVSIPLRGGKASLNVGVAFGILARYWTDAL